MTAIITDVHYRMSVAIIRDLAARGVRVVVCEKDTHPNPVGFASKFAARRAVLPESGYENALLSLCREVCSEDGEKPALLPVGAVTLALVSEHAERFSAVCGLAAASPAQLNLLNDKAAVSRLARQLSVPVPADFCKEPCEADAAFFARVALPCVVKPLCGEKFGLPAAKRYRICRTKDELQAAYAHFSALTHEEPVVQEYLPGEAYGCSVLADHGKIVRSICHHRLREYPVSGGPSSCCACVDYPELLRCAGPIIRESGFTGPAMLEFKCGADGVPRLLEINPRVWGTYPLTHISGSDFSYAWFCLVAGLPLPPVQTPKPCRMVYYPSDFAAGLGYLKAGRPGAFLSVLKDFLNPAIKNGLASPGDPGPARAYFRGLFHRGGRK